MSFGIFTAVTCSSKIKSKKLKALEIIDSYFYLGGKKIKIISAKDNILKVELVDRKASLAFTALKVASYCTLILPAILLISKFALRCPLNIHLCDDKKTRKIDAIRKIVRTYKHYKAIQTSKQIEQKSYLCSLRLKFSEGNSESFLIKNEKERDQLFNKIAAYLDSPSKQIKLKLTPSPDSLYSYDIYDLSYDIDHSHFKSLKHQIEKESDELIFSAKPEVQFLKKNPYSHQLIYQSGVEEYIIDEQNHSFRGMRIAPDGTIEHGIFSNSDRALFSGFKKTGDAIEIKDLAIKLYYSSDKPTEFKIHNLEQLEEFFEVLKKFLSTHHHQPIEFSYYPLSVHTILSLFNLPPFVDYLNLSQNNAADRISIHPRLVKEKKLADQHIKRIYQSGVEEHFLSLKGNWEGWRRFPDGRIEMGKFSSSTGFLVAGCISHEDRTLEFINNYYKFEVSFDHFIRKIEIHAFSQVENFIDKIFEKSGLRNLAIALTFKNHSQMQQTIKLFHYAKRSEELDFQIGQSGSTLFIRKKPLHSEHLDNGFIRQVFANGVIEEFIYNDPIFEGVRLFPDGNKEVGKFHKTGELFSGHIEENGILKFFDPSYIASFDVAKKKYRVAEREDELVVFEHVEKKLYILSKVPLETVLLGKTGCAEFYQKILTHQYFQPRLKPFFEKLIASDGLQAPPIFKFKRTLLEQVIKAAVQTENLSFDPLKILDSQSGKNLIVHAASFFNASNLLKLFIDNFPKAFLASGQEVIIEQLKNNPLFNPKKIIKAYCNMGGELDSFTQFCITISLDRFKKEHLAILNSLTADQKCLAYEIAFQQGNPHIFEPAHVPIRPEQYYLNFMWINKKRSLEDQELLFGEGDTEEDRLLDFQKKFINPITTWAKKNPQNPITIWIDSNMSPHQVVNRSEQLLKDALKGIPHGKVRFKDIRSLEPVSTYPQVFEQEVPLYFRVDLAKAIIADHALREKERQFFVYADLDMKPLSGKKLFDQRTINYLNDYGFVMAKGGFYYENSFQIANSYHEQFIKSHRKVIIDLTIAMFLDRPEKIKEQQIYDTYVPMFAHLLNEDGRFGKSIDKLKDAHLQIDHFGGFGTLITENKHIYVREHIPTKPIVIPPSHFFSLTIK
ncbi:hypothetical protein PHSC3_001220 [Chlamydiales bacterium STE3]|nr:hypothetical protein PHSC3_001220 [Chlamydiales bacterium STE3]